MKGYNLYKIDVYEQVNYVDRNWFACLLVHFRFIIPSKLYIHYLY